MDLFKQAAAEARDQPLAARMRPRTLEEFVGQEHIVGPGRLLRRAIQADQLSSLIFYGPPGTGKTTLAVVIASQTRSHFITINAVLAGVAAIREAIDEAQRRKELYGQRTILFVDEVHRWNKAQQDALLPWVENGTIILVGATTENPYFEVNRALVSRSRIFQLVSLTDDHIRRIALAALKDPERGYGRYRVQIAPGALDHLVRTASGDARTVLNALELAVETTPERFPPSPEEVIRISPEVAEDSIQKRAVLYDKEGDYHFDTISAFIKSLRGSDPDAALYWLAKMVYAGEDPRYLFRRMIIFAAEDIGLADPHAVVVAESNAAAFDRVGLPEGRFHLANTTLYLATSPKSNSVMGFFDALKLVEQERDLDMPVHLRDGSRDAEGFGHGEGYLYPHAYRGHWVAQQYLPDALQGRVFYQPTDVGREAAIRDAVVRSREVQLAAMLEREGQPRELLTASPGERGLDRWVERAMSGQSEELALIRDRLFAQLSPRRQDRVLVLNAGCGLLVWEACRRVPEGGVWALVREPERVSVVERPLERLEQILRPAVMAGEARDLPGLLRERGEADVLFEAILGKDALTRDPDRARTIAMLAAAMAAGGSLLLAETVPSESQRLSEYLSADALEPSLLEGMRQAECEVYSSREDPLMGWGASELGELCGAAGLEVRELESQDFAQERLVTRADLKRWLGDPSGGGGSALPPYGRALAGVVGPEGHSRVREALAAALSDRRVSWRRRVCFVHARK